MHPPAPGRRQGQPVENLRREILLARLGARSSGRRGWLERVFAPEVARAWAQDICNPPAGLAAE